MAWISSGCMPQNSAICVKVNAVFSISHTAVAFGIKGRLIGGSLSWTGRGDSQPVRSRARIPAERGDMASGQGWVKAENGYYTGATEQRRPEWLRRRTSRSAN